METTILHVDMDAFFANVEKVDNPELKNVPVIVGIHPYKSSRGVVATCCYIARKYGVKSAMPTAQAIRLCPDAIFIEPNSSRYSQVSKLIMQCFQKFTPQIEQISIDEAFLDITGCEKLFGTAKDIAVKIQSEIYQETSLTCSIGIAPNKFLAKLASDLNKPNGITTIEPEDIGKVLDPLPVSKIWGVGEKQRAKLLAIGIKTIADLKEIEQRQLESMFGVLGSSLYKLSRGIDLRSVETVQEVKSISNEITFNEDILEEGTIKAYLLKLCDKVSRRMRKQNNLAKTIHMKIRYHNFNTVTLQSSLAEPTSSPSEIFNTVWELFLKKGFNNSKIRLLGVGVSNLYPDNYRPQLSLFTDVGKIDKENNLLNSLDSIMDKYGEGAIYRGSEKNVRGDKDGSLI